MSPNYIQRTRCLPQKANMLIIKLGEFHAPAILQCVWNQWSGDAGGFAGRRVTDVMKRGGLLFLVSVFRVCFGN